MLVLECATCSTQVETLEEAQDHEIEEQMTDEDHGGWDVVDTEERQ